MTITANDHDLLEHLLNDPDGALWVPGAEPHARNEPALFAPYAFPPMLRAHPTNPNQTAVLIGNIGGDGDAPVLLAGVALANLAHPRGECSRCAPVWRAATEQWARVPDEDGHESLFAVVADQPLDNGLAVWLLVHAQDVPAALDDE